MQNISPFLIASTSWLIPLHNQLLLTILEDTFDIKKMTSVEQDNHQKKGRRITLSSICIPRQMILIQKLLNIKSCKMIFINFSIKNERSVEISSS